MHSAVLLFASVKLHKSSDSHMSGDKKRWSSSYKKKKPKLKSIQVSMYNTFPLLSRINLSKYILLVFWKMSFDDLQLEAFNFKWKNR